MHLNCLWNFSQSSHSFQVFDNLKVKLGLEMSVSGPQSFIFIFKINFVTSINFIPILKLDAPLSPLACRDYRKLCSGNDRSLFGM